MIIRGRSILPLLLNVERGVKPVKLMYGNVPVKSLNIHHFEMDTNDASLQPSDMQAGITAYARGQKVVGTGKAFSFAMYGRCSSNEIIPIPVNTVNTVLISADSYATKMAKTILELQELDFTIPQTVANVSIDGTDYAVTVQASSGVITVACDKTVTLQVLFGKDEYTI